MSTADVPDASESSVARRVVARRTRWLFVALAAIAGGQLPLLVLHLRQLWQAPFYQHFPLVLVAAAALFRARWPAADEPTRAFRTAAVLGILFALSAWGAAALVSSPWLAGFAAICTAGALIAWRGARLPDSNLGACWLLLWLLLPLPMGLDEELVTWLQSVSSAVSGDILEWLDVPHLRTGNVIALADRELFVDEACSGINSFFALWSLTALHCVLAYRPWLFSACLLSSSLVWSVVMNVTRIVIIAAIPQLAGYNLATGWPHEILGFATFLMAVGLTVSTDAGLVFVFGPVAVGSRESRDLRRQSALAPLWDGTFAITRRFFHRVDPAARPRKLSMSPAWCVLCVSTAIALGGLELWQLNRRQQWTAGLFGHAPATNNFTSQLAAALAVGEDTLPPAIGDWQRVSFRATQRDTASIYGEHSRTFEFRSPRGTAIVSLDFPFDTPHNLSLCYQGRGWRIDSVTAANAGVLDRAVIMDMTTDVGERARVLFLHFTPQGDVALATNLVPRSLSERLAARFSEPLLPDADLVYQLQLLLPLSRGTEEELEDARRLLTAVRAALRGPLGIAAEPVQP